MNPVSANTTGMSRLTWTAGIVVGASLPHWSSLPVWMPALLVTCVLWRFAARLLRWPLPGRKLMWLLTFVSFGTVLYQFRTINGLQPGTALLMGLGLVFFGMTVMSDAMAPLRSYQPFGPETVGASPPEIVVGKHSGTQALRHVLALRGIHLTEEQLAHALEALWGARREPCRDVPAGDYDGDGVVGATDYDVWKESMGSTSFLSSHACHHPESTLHGDGTASGSWKLEDQVIVGDLEDAEEMADDYDVMIGNFHCEAIAHRQHKGLLLRGFPNWEQVGNSLKNDVLYEGGSYFLFEAANTASKARNE